MSGQKHKQYKDKRIEEAIKELDGYRIRKKQIQRLKAEIAELEDELYSIKAVDYSKDKVQGGKFKDMVVEKTVEWAMLEERLRTLVCESEQELFIIENKLKRLTFNEQQVIVYYYINCKTVDAIALLMNFSEKCVRNTKKRALLHYAGVKL